MDALNRRAFTGLALLFLAMVALLFIPAGTLHYWQAWTFLAVYFLASLAFSLYAMKKDRALLARRMRGGPFSEKEAAQRVILFFASLGFIGLLVVPALDRRYGWSHVPPYAVLAGDAIVVLGWIAIFFVLRENSFASATIETAQNQKVISTGPYAPLRHPMYAASLVMLLGLPIALGSWWGLLVMIEITSAVIWRLLDEERFLARNLPGYVEYEQKVRHRLIPLVW